MEMAKVTSKGQITIPISIRRKLNIDQGDKLLFIDRPEGVLMVNPDMFQGELPQELFAAPQILEDEPSAPADTAPADATTAAMPAAQATANVTSTASTLSTDFSNNTEAEALNESPNGNAAESDIAISLAATDDADAPSGTSAGFGPMKATEEPEARSAITQVQQQEQMTAKEQVSVQEQLTTTQTQATQEQIQTQASAQASGSDQRLSQEIENVSVQSQEQPQTTMSVIQAIESTTTEAPQADAPTPLDPQEITTEAEAETEATPEPPSSPASGFDVAAMLNEIRSIGSKI